MDDDSGQTTAVHGSDAISNDRPGSGQIGDHTEVTTTMQRSTKRIVAAVAVIALLAAGGAAFTASIQGLDGQNANIGFGSETVTGATATGVNYALDSNGQYVDQVVVTLTGDFTSGYSFKGSLMDPSGAVEQTGVCTPGTPYTSPSTTLTCDFTRWTGSAGGTATGGGASTTGVPVDTVNGFDLSVTGTTSDSSGTGSNLNGS
jgi:hypothetical protein